MKKSINKVIVKQGENTLEINITNRNSYCAVLKDGEKIIETFNPNPHVFSCIVPVGEYEIISNKEVEGINTSYTDTNLIKVQPDFRREYLRYASQESFRMRSKILPDYKIQNAALGIYDEKTTQVIRATIQAFRAAYHKIEQQVEEAESEADLQKIELNFPTALIEK